MTIAFTVLFIMLVMSSLILAGYSENRVTCKRNWKTDSENLAKFRI